MSSQEWSSAPFVECPACGKTFQVDDLCEWREDKDLECPCCATKIVMSVYEPSVDWAWRTKS